MKGVALPIVRIETDDINTVLFWEKVEKLDNGCWAWQAYKDSMGYGAFAVNGKPRLAHRVSYVIEFGAIPEGKHLDHLCRNPSCVNPGHLEPVSQKENSLRGVGVGALNKIKTHCNYGHEFNDSNTRIEIKRNGKEQRQCMACRRRRGNESYARKRRAQ